MRRPSKRLEQWIRDFDPQMVVRWSEPLQQFVIERSARISQKLLGTIHARLQTVYDTTETNSHEKLRRIESRKMLRADLAAILCGRRVLFAFPDDYPEHWLQRDMVQQDPWRFGDLRTKGEEEIGRRAYEQFLEADERRDREYERTLHNHVRANAFDIGREMAHKLGSRVYSPGLG